ncbi:helix-turn-helix domain-containing protein [Chryseobacterium oranimense]|uniref:helix-turn-helix domain-containing protein n=1 Tax=Chryseobacterium oranimense TaxID=421058 RepID=UPI0031D1AEDE
MEKSSPNYKLIYRDIINKKYPNKISICQKILSKEKLSVLDIIRLNDIIFDNSQIQNSSKNQKLRSYDRETILKILDFQKMHNLNNLQTASHFKLSRNTIRKWKMIYL